jgi:hypothetical protein
MWVCVESRVHGVRDDVVLRGWWNHWRKFVPWPITARDPFGSEMSTVAAVVSMTNGHGL